MTEKFSPTTETVTLPFPKAMYIPDKGNMIVERNGINLTICHSYNPPDCFNCEKTDCKHAGEKGNQLREFWDLLEGV